MAKVNVYSLKGEVTGEIELPQIFEEVYRQDVIKRAEYELGIITEDTDRLKLFFFPIQILRLG